jgi:hypothetical protein
MRVYFASIGLSISFKNDIILKPEVYNSGIEAGWVQTFFVLLSQEHLSNVSVKDQIPVQNQ